MGYIVTNTLFKKRQSHLVTAVDMILIKREHKKRIMNTKVIPGENMSMDIYLKVRKYR